MELYFYHIFSLVVEVLSKYIVYDIAIFSRIIIRQREIRSLNQTYEMDGFFFISCNGFGKILLR